MKTPDQIIPYSKEEKIDIEKKEFNQPVLHILKETAEKFRSLDQGADVALQSRGDTATYKQKLEEQAKLLINLPNLLSGKLEGLDSEVKQRIVRDTEWLATSAKEALENNNSFVLGVLLTHQGNKNTDKNDLEELIAFIEK